MPAGSANNKHRPLSQAILLLVAVSGPAVGGAAGLAMAIAWADALREGGPMIMLILVAIGLIGCAFWVLPTHLLSLICGWAMGFWFGATTALITATLAAPVGYGAATKILGASGLNWVNRYPKGAAVCRAITHASPLRAGVLVALLRLSPAVPYGATNVLAAIFRLPQKVFVAGTFLGLAPRVCAVAGLGAGLERLDATSKSAPALAVLGIGATVALIAVIGWITRVALNQSLPATETHSASV